MKLYTKTGDDGSTGLFGGQRVRKTHPRVIAYGAVDELNAAIGHIVAALNETESQQHLRRNLQMVQTLLFEIGADLATPADSPSRRRISEIAESDIARLEGWIDQASEATPPQTSFILPGGCESACRLHTARTICRRAEREVIALLDAGEPVATSIVIALNRLSDLLFAWARWVNLLEGVRETSWTPRSQQG